MKLPWKKILILIGFIAIVIVFAYLLYYFFFKPPTRPTLPILLPEEALLPGELPTTVNVNERVPTEVNVNAALPTGKVIQPPSKEARGGLTKVSQLTSGSVKGATVAPDGSLLYYDEATGKFYRLLPDGTLVELSSKVFYQVEKVTWASEANQAILEYPDGTNILYDFTKNKQYTLPKEMQDFAFADSGTKIAAEIIGPNTENNWLITANPDGTGLNFVEQIGNEMENVIVDWSPNGQVIASFRDSYDADRQEIILIGQNHENFKSFIPQGRGFEGQWTPQGDKMLYSVYSADNDFRPKLWLTDAGPNNFGYNNIDLNLNTWSNKCTINQDSTAAYCAVPRELPLGSAWYPELAQEIPDDFYYIDLTTGRYSLLAIPSGEIDFSASQVFLSPEEDELYFVDQSNNNVYSFNLP